MTALAATVRLARRDARHHRGRTALVVLLLAVPAALLLFAVTFARTVDLSARAENRLRYGRADVDVAGLPGDAGLTPRVVADLALPPGVRALAVEEYVESPVMVGNRWVRAALSATNLANPMLDGRFTMISGRPPTTAAEAAVTPSLARRLVVADGATITVLGRDVRVTGVVRENICYSCARVVLGAALGPDSAARIVGQEFLLTVPAGTAWPTFTGANGFAIVHGPGIEDGKKGFPMASVYAGGIVALAILGVVVAAAFAVGARRQLRHLGLVAATGAEPRHLRLQVMVAGTITSVVGAVLGVLLGVVAVVMAGRADLYNRAGNRVVAGIRLTPIDIVLVLAMTVLAGTVSAYGPARAVAKVPVLAALAGRRPLVPVTRRGPLVAVALVAGGLVGLVVAAEGHAWPLGVGAGVLVIVGGVVASPWLIVATAGFVGRVGGGAVRLGARAVGRQRGRSAPIVGAIAATSAGAIALASFALGSSRNEERQNPSSFPKNQVLVEAIGAGVSARVDPPADALAALARMLPRATAVRFGVVDVAARAYAAIVVVVAGPELLDALGRADADAVLSSGDAVVLGTGRVVDGHITIQRSDGTTTRLPAVTAPAVTTMLVSDLASSSVIEAGEVGAASSPPVPVVVTDAVAAAAGLVATGHSTLFAQASALTADERGGIDDVQTDLVAAGVAKASIVITFDHPYHSAAARVRAVISAIGVAAAMAVVAIGLALTSAESRNEDIALVALGAPPRLRRRMRAVEAILLSATAGALAVPLGILPALAVLAARSYPYVFPWTTVVLLAVLVPLAAGGLGWLSAGQWWDGTGAHEGRAGRAAGSR